MNPNLLLMLQAYGLRGTNGGMPEFAGQANPLAAMLMAQGQLTKRKDLSGRYILPSTQARSSGGIDWLRANGPSRFRSESTKPVEPKKQSKSDWMAEAFNRYR